MKKELLGIYKRLYVAFGPRHWWPADTPFEVIVGAILTQNTAWKNVEKAISNLKKAKALSPIGLKRLNRARLAGLVRPAGYFNIKAERLKCFIDYLFKHHSGRLNRMFKAGTKKLRKELLAIKGIGPETCDSILLYAAGRPTFVVDSYTKRIFSRHNLVSPDSRYEEVQALFMDNLPRKAKLFNEYHALIVQLGKEFCRKKPRCKECPLKD